MRAEKCVALVACGLEHHSPPGDAPQLSGTAWRDFPNMWTPTPQEGPPSARQQLLFSNPPGAAPRSGAFLQWFRPRGLVGTTRKLARFSPTSTTPPGTRGRARCSSLPNHICTSSCTSTAFPPQPQLARHGPRHAPLVEHDDADILAAEGGGLLQEDPLVRPSKGAIKGRDGRACAAVRSRRPRARGAPDRSCLRSCRSDLTEATLGGAWISIAATILIVFLFGAVGEARVISESGIGVGAHSRRGGGTRAAAVAACAVCVIRRPGGGGQGRPSPSAPVHVT